MSEEEAACLSGYTGQYISDPAGPQLPRFSVMYSGGEVDKWKEDAEPPHEGYLNRNVFSFVLFFSLFVELRRQVASCFR